MKHSTNQKIVPITAPAAIVDNAAFVTGTVDCLGFTQLTIVVMLGALDAALAMLKLQESDDSGMAGAVDIAGANYAVDSTLPSATADNNLYAFHVELRGRKRFIDLQFTGGDGASGTFAVAFAILSQGTESPDSAAKRGFAAELFV